MCWFAILSGGVIKCAFSSGPHDGKSYHQLWVAFAGRLVLSVRLGSLRQTVLHKHPLSVSYCLVLLIGIIWHVHYYSVTNGCWLIIPPLQWRWKGAILVSPCPSVRLFICGQNYVRSISSTIFDRSTSYFTFYQATSEGVSRVKFLSKLKNLKFCQIL